jgi:hypothetical protein
VSAPVPEAAKAVAGGVAGAGAVLFVYAADVWRHFVAFCDYVTFWN